MIAIVKKLLLLLTFLPLLKAQAGDFRYLTFEMKDGVKTSVDVSSLALTINDRILTVASKSFAISNLNRMYFSASDETTTGIELLTSELLDEAVEVYDLKGHKVQKNKIKNGVYVVKTKERIFKLVKK